MTHTARYTIPIFRGQLVVILTDDPVDVCKRFKVDEEAAKSGGFCFSHKAVNGYLRYYIVVPLYASYETLSHESLHAVHRICEDRDIEISPATEEVQAYLLGWVMGRVSLAAEKVNKMTRISLNENEVVI